MKKLLAVLLAACVAASLSGCTATELYERLLISAIGVDLADNGYTVTVRAPETVENGVEQSYQSTGKTVLEALNRLSLSTGKKPLYSHNTVVVFGRACAEAGLEHVLDFFIRHYESRPTVKVFLAENRAEDILAGDTDAAALAALSKSGAYSGLAIDADLIDLVNGAARAGSSAALPLLGGEQVSVIGTAVFSGYTLRSVLGEGETRGLLALRGTLDAGDVYVRHPDLGDVCLTVLGVERTLHFTGNSKNPRFEVALQIEGEIGSVSAGSGIVEHDAFARLERALSNALLADVEAYLSAAIFSEIGDSAGLSAAVWRDAPEVWRADAATRTALLRRAQFDVTVSATIARVEEENLPYF